MNDEGKLATRLPVEDRDQPPVGIKLHGAFGRDPVGTAWPARVRGALCDIEDHGVRRRADAANRRARGRLAGNDTRRDDGDESAEKERANRARTHADSPYTKSLAIFHRECLLRKLRSPPRGGAQLYKLPCTRELHRTTATGG